MAICKNCDVEYLKHRASKGSFCSRKCYWFSMKGVAPNNGTMLNGHKGKKHTQEYKLLMSNLFLGKKLPHTLGENHPKWIKDRTKLVRSEKKHLDGQYRDWVFAVKNRDNWKCRIADIKCNGRLEAHHILNWKEYPELRYDINNGITLCHSHHPKGREKEKRLIPTFQELVSVSKV